MEHGDLEPPTLFKLGVLHKAAHEAKNDALGVKKNTKLFDSLQSLKKDVLLNKFIKEIGFDKFYFLYWSPEQITVYNDIQKYCCNPVSFDATGSVALQIDREFAESSSIFLSVIVTHIGKTIVPVGQILSEKNDTNLLTYALNEWRKSGAKVPREIITDMGKALQNAICLSFNVMTLQEYNDHCLMILLGERQWKSLKCQLRTDVAHLQHCISKWPCFSSTSIKMKKLYTKCTGFMTTINNIEHFVEFLKNLLYLTKSRLFNEKCQEILKYLIERIKTFKFDERINDSIKWLSNEAKEKIFVDNDVKNEKSITTQFIEDIDQSINFNDSFICNNSLEYQDNVYYSLDFAKRVSTLCHEFPSWTNVMNSFFNNTNEVASSARSETYFGQIKNSLLEDRRPLRADKLIIKHCREIDSVMKTSRAAVINCKLSGSTVPNKIIKDDNYYLYASERWRNQFSLIQHESRETSISSAFEKPIMQSTFDENIVPHINNSITCLVNEQCDAVNEVDLGNSSWEEHSYCKKKEESDVNDNKQFGEDKKQIDGNKSKLLRGFNVIPDPQLALQLQKPDNGRKGSGIIQNGNKIMPKVINGKKITFLNTCPYDAITEILSSSYCNVDYFRQFLEKNKNNYANTIVQYSISGVNNSLYTNRAYILYSLYNTSENVINCEDNVSSLFEKLMIEHPSIKELLECESCFHKKEINKTILPIPNLKIVTADKYTTLEENLMKHFYRKEVFCPACNSNNGILKKQITNYLYIDTEDVYNITKDSTVENSSISDIPVVLKLQGNSIILSGIVEYVPCEEGGIAHYVAYCRMINGTWQLKNDLLKKHQLLSRKQITNKILISAIFYAQYKNID